MSSIYIGTAYHQVYKVPLDQKQPIVKYGQKRKSPVTSIHLCSTQHPQYTNTLFYSDPYESYQINTLQNQIVCTEKFSDGQVDKQKILSFQFLNNKRIYYTNHGDIYYRNKLQQQQQWNKLYYNEAYANIMNSLPPQRAGKLPPQYTKVLVERNNKIQIGFVGRGVLPFIYCAQDRTITWKARNVTNDELDLQIPPNDVDLCFLNAGYHLAVAHAQNKIRIYDIKSRRKKPISDTTLTQIIKFQKSNISNMKKSTCEKYLYIGNHKGSIYELDTRKNLAISAKIKGITSTIKDMQVHGQYLATASLDGYLRIYNTTTKEKLFERYLNIHPQIIKLDRNGIVFPHEQPVKYQQINLHNQQQEEQQEKKPQKVKKIRKRNKVGLKYLNVDNAWEMKKEQKRQQQNQQRVMKQQKPDYKDEDLDL